MSAADTLREAADRLEGLAKGATPGPWYVPRLGQGIDAGEYDTVIGCGPVECMAYCYGGSSTIEGGRLAEDQAYIAAMSPEVGLALAAWLRHVADQEAAGWTGVPAVAHRDHALAVARAILGGDA